MAFLRAYVPWFPCGMMRWLIQRTDVSYQTFRFIHPGMIMGLKRVAQLKDISNFVTITILRKSQFLVGKASVVQSTHYLFSSRWRVCSTTKTQMEECIRKIVKATMGSMAWKSVDEGGFLLMVACSFLGKWLMNSDLLRQVFHLSL